MSNNSNKKRSREEFEEESEEIKNKIQETENQIQEINQEIKKKAKKRKIKSNKQKVFLVQYEQTSAYEGYGWGCQLTHEHSIVGIYSSRKSANESAKKYFDEQYKEHQEEYKENEDVTIDDKEVNCGRTFRGDYLINGAGGIAIEDQSDDQESHVTVSVWVEEMNVLE
eukprot:540495_1